MGHIDCNKGRVIYYHGCVGGGQVHLCVVCVWGGGWGWNYFLGDLRRGRRWTYIIFGAGEGGGKGVIHCLRHIGCWGSEFHCHKNMSAYWGGVGGQSPTPLLIYFQFIYFYSFRLTEN